MNVTNPNTDRVIFTRDAQPILVEGLTAPLDVTVQRGAAMVSFQLVPISGKVTIDLQSVLSSFVVPYNPYFVGVDSTSPIYASSIPETVLRLNSGTDSQDLPMFCINGAAGSAPLSASRGQWLVVGPQKVSTFPKVKETLACVLPGTFAPTVKVKCLAWMAVYPQIEFTLATHTSTSIPAILEVDCSPSLIKDHLKEEDSKYASDTLIAYDIYAEVSDSTGQLVYRIPERRYLMSYDDFGTAEWFFLNSFGLPERILSRKGKSDLMEGSNALFVSGSETREIAGDYIRKYESRSGYIDSMEERESWFQFLKSAYKRIWDGDTTRKAVVESVEIESRPDEPAHFSFTWRYSQDRGVAPASRTSLNEFSYGKLQ